MFDEELIEISRLTLEAFRTAGKTIATAESCTGGMIAALLTEIPGSSDVFSYGFVTYSNEAKAELLGVSEDILQSVGAVSAETALAMASGARNSNGADVAVAVTGIAGPSGGSDEKPVGTVFLAIAAGEELGSFVEKFEFGDIGRAKIRRETTKEALEMLLSYGLDEQ